MDVVIDGKRGVIDVPPNAPFKIILDSIYSWTSTQRRAVVTLRLDGLYLSEERQTSLKEKPLSGSQVLEVITQSHADVALSILDDLGHHLVTMRRLQEGAEGLIVSGQYQQGLTALLECFRAWGLLMDAVGRVVKVAGLDLRTVRVEGETLEDRVLKVHEVLSRLQSALDTKDVVRLGDLTQYELGALLEAWPQFLERLRAGIRPVPSLGT
jgi:hypothetical protein